MALSKKTGKLIASLINTLQVSKLVKNNAITRMGETTGMEFLEAQETYFRWNKQERNTIETLRNMGIPIEE